MLDDAETATRLSTRRRAVRVRDGAAMMALIHLPLRIGNFATLTLGETLIAREEGYAIRIESEAAKGGRAIEALLPSRASAALKRYIDHHRPGLVDPGVSGQRVWLTDDGGPYRPSVFSERIAWLTQSRFGLRVGPPLAAGCHAQRPLRSRGRSDIRCLRARGSSNLVIVHSSTSIGSISRRTPSAR